MFTRKLYFFKVYILWILTEIVLWLKLCILIAAVKFFRDKIIVYMIRVRNSDFLKALWSVF